MRTAFLICGVLAAGSAVAQDTPLQLDDLVVTTATRTETDLNDAMANVRVVTRDDILRSGATDSIELLRYFAGIDIARTGGPGQQTSIFMRGAESNHTLVLIDGIRSNPATIGVPAIQNITPEQIDRIEIVTGPRSSLYGSDAIGGVINIITTAATPERAVSIGGGTKNTERASAQWGVRSGDTVFRAGIDQLRTGGVPTRSADDTDRGFENLSARLSLSTPLAGGQLIATHWQASGDTEYSDFFLNPVTQEFENQVTTLGWNKTISDHWTTEVIIGRLVDDLQQVESPDSVKSTRLSIDWQNTFQVNANHQLVAGAYLAQETGKALSFGLGFDEDVDIRAAYVQDQYRNDRFQALVGVRLSDHEAFGNELTWNAGAGYDVTDQFTVQLDAGRAFRAPDTTDRFGFGGNQGLDAETSTQYQLRGIYSLDNGLRISVEAFRNEIDDLIEFDFATFQLFNIAQATIEGVGADLRWVNDRWQVEVGVTHQDARNAETDTRLLRRARVTSSARISRRFGQHSVDLSWRSDDARRDFGGVRLAGYGIASISGRFALTADLALTARVDNVTDKQFETAAGFNQLGRSTTVQLRYTF